MDNNNNKRPRHQIDNGYFGANVASFSYVLKMQPVN